MTNWVKITAFLNQVPEDWSIFGEAFERFGCPSSIQFDRPPSISGYLVEVPGVETQTDALKGELLRLGVERVEIEVVPDEDWSELWKAHFKPIKVGKNVMIRPTWEAAPEIGDGIEIVLDPGQAFGTGDHPTTRMCLELLEAEIESHRPTAVFDLGTGSGILAILAKRMGVPEVFATDIDPISVEVARANAALNQVEFQVEVANGLDSVPARTWPLVISNIISATLIRFAPEMALRVEPGGRWIVSGVIRDNWDGVRLAAENAGFQLITHQTEGDWVAAVFTR